MESFRDNFEFMFSSQHTRIMAEQHKGFRLHSKANGEFTAEFKSAPMTSSEVEMSLATIKCLVDLQNSMFRLAQGELDEGDRIRFNRELKDLLDTKTRYNCHTYRDIIEFESLSRREPTGNTWEDLDINFINNEYQIVWMALNNLLVDVYEAICDSVAVTP